MSPLSNAAYALPIGHALHEYRIESVLGAGGFGITYLAVDTHLEAQVAIKEYMPLDFAFRDEEQAVRPRSGNTLESFNWGLTRFLDEARALASFHHPNIVRVLRFFEANNTGYMVMELVHGSSVVDWVRPKRPLSREQLLALAGGLLDGLELVHQAGYLHRDIKPPNIFVRPDESPVLIDFGSARRLHGGEQELTAIVSAGFAPLEQYDARGKQGPWSDLYALGGVLYWLVTAKKPVEVFSRVRKDTLPPAQQLGDAQRYGKSLLAAIDWALQINEQDRPQTVAELRRALGGPLQSAPRKAGGPPAQPAVAPGTATEGVSGVTLTQNDMERLLSELAGYLGPIASVLVRDAAKRAGTISELAAVVAPEIGDEGQRARFVRHFVSGDFSGRTTVLAPDPSASQKFTPAVLRRAETELANYIGAIAKVVVRRAAAKARDEAELYLLIADEIDSPTERTAFVKKAISAHGKR